MIAHIVLFEPKPEVSSDERSQFLRVLTETMKAVPSIRRARLGSVVELGLSPEMFGGHMTYSYAAVVEFADRAGLQDYLQHPSHDVLRSEFWRLCLNALIADVEMFDPTSEPADFSV